MSVIDDDELTRILREAADGLTVSEGGRDHVLDVARGSSHTTRTGTLTRLASTSRPRTVFLAAAALVIVCAVAWPLVRLEVPPNARTHHASAGGVRAVGGDSSSGGVAGLSVKGATAPVGANLSAGNVATSTATATPARIASNGQVDLTIADGHFDRALASLTALARSDGGFVSSTQAHEGTASAGDYSYGTVVLSVPQTHFDTLVAQVQRVGHATSVVARSTDVTSQYVDLQARISALEVSRQQYLTIMSHATSIGDILAVQAQINTLQSEIEQLQGQLKVLTTATTYSSLTVLVAEAGHRYNTVPTSRSGLANAVHDSVRGFVDGVEWLIRVAGPALFAVLLFAGVVGLLTLVWRMTRRRMI